MNAGRDCGLGSAEEWSTAVRNNTDEPENVPSERNWLQKTTYDVISFTWTVQSRQICGNKGE